MRFERWKTFNGTGTIMRYYELADGQEAKTNHFYGVDSNGKATLITSALADGSKLGFCHGGDNLVEGKIFLELNPAEVFRVFLEDGDEDLAVGDEIFGCLEVIAVHEDGVIEIKKKEE